MTYLDQLGERIKAGVPEDVLPKGDTSDLFRLYALLALAKGDEVDAEDVHNAWAVWMMGRDPEHESIRPYAELDERTRRSDDPYVVAIREAAAGLAPESSRS